jgi:thioredoxin reductase (NADPH)
MKHVNNSKIDLLIIGGGPIGLACAIEAKKAGFTYVIIEKGCLVNSLFHYPKTMTFFSTADRLEIGQIPFMSVLSKPNRNEALEYYRRVSHFFDLHIRLFEEVLQVNPLSEEEGFEIFTTKNNYRAQNVVVATGFYDIPNRLHIPGEDLPKVHHYYSEPHYYSGQEVIVVGASNSAIDAALETYRKGAKVTLVIRKNVIGPRVKYWVKPDIENRIAAGEIKVYFESQLTHIHEETATLSTPNGIITLPNNFVLALTGYQPNFSFLQKLGIQLDSNAAMEPLHNKETMETNIDGLFLAGVVCGGLNTHVWFIENSRIHAQMIVQTLIKRRNA